MKITLFSGSPRSESRTHPVALDIQKRFQQHEGVEIAVADVRALNFPILDDVYSRLENPPAGMDELHAQLEASDAIVVVSPEHNGSYSGALKNTLDYFFPEYVGKPWGIVTVSSGRMGGIRCAQNLIMFAHQVQAVPYHRYLLTPLAHTLFNEQNEVTDEGHADRADKFVEGFLDFANKIGRM